MTNATQPPTPAARLAAVLCALVPGKVVTVHWPPAVRVSEAERIQDHDEWFRPEQKDDLARVVGMLGPKQLAKFDSHIALLLGERVVYEGKTIAATPLGSATIIAPSESWLAALEAAVK